MITGASGALGAAIAQRLAADGATVLLHANSRPESVERLAAEARGAIAVLTPDDIGGALNANTPQARPRQNVVLEIGWFWGRLGRGRCLLMSRGPLEMPSDLSGVGAAQALPLPPLAPMRVRGWSRSRR